MSRLGGAGGGNGGGGVAPIVAEVRKKEITLTLFFLFVHYTILIFKNIAIFKNFV